MGNTKRQRFQWTTDEDGVRFCIDREARACVDIDVPKGVKSVTIGTQNFRFVEMAHNSKRFPDVEELVIRYGILSIEIPNLMFPNVRKVTSYSPYYEDGASLKHKENKYTSVSTLRNAFCLHDGETLDLKDVDTIETNALTGCGNIQMINTDKINCIADNAFAGSAFEDMEPDKEIGLLIRGTLLIADDGRESLDIPPEITAVYFTRIDLKKKKSVKMHRMEMIDYIGYYGLPDTFVMAKDMEYDSTESFNQAIMERIFSNTSRIEVEDGNPDFKSVDGVLYTSDMTCLVKCPGQRTGDIVIPDGVEVIFDSAFIESKITSVKMPDSLREIGNGAFYNCQDLEHVDFGHGVTEINGRSNGYAFYQKRAKNPFRRKTMT